MAHLALQVLLLIPECLEMVLMELDPSTLLTSAQRVCKTWHKTITTSQPLQRKLFLTPDAGPAGKDRTPNPLLAKTFPAFFTTGLSIVGRIPREEVLRQLGDPLQAPAWGREALLRKGASWRRMYPEYPVSFKIGFIDCRGSCELSFYSGVLDVPEGVTMGKLFDVAYTMMLGRDYYSSHFGVYWREKSKDPQVHDWSWKCGGEEVPLSKFPEDVKIVICPKVNDIAIGHARPSESIDVLNKLYMPADFEFCPVALKFVFSQDWFG